MPVGPRIYIGKQTELSAVPFSIVRTDGANEQEYVAPGAVGTVLTIDGAGIPNWAAGGAGGAITVADTNCIDLGGVGTVADPLTADLILDPAGNLECTAAGLRVEPSPNVGDVLTTSAVGVVTWEPGGDYLPMQQAASVLGVTHAALGTFVGTPSGTLTFVNTSATRSMEVIIQMGTNFEVDVPNTFWATDGFITELSVNGGAYATAYNQQLLAGGTYPGNTVRVQNSVSIDRLSALTVLPGATLTLNIRATTTVLERTTIVGSVANNTILKAWGHYI